MVRTVARAIDYDGNGYFVSDWTRDHANFFRSIELTKSMMFFILLILVVVAAINLVATLVMIVKEKQTDIAILRTIGAAPVNVLRMFLVQGALIGLVGTLAGALLGWVLALNVTERSCTRSSALFGIQFLDASVYLMSDLPSEVRLARRAAGVAAWRSRSRRSPLSTRRGARRARCRRRPYDMTECNHERTSCSKPRASRARFARGPSTSRCCRA